MKKSIFLFFAAILCAMSVSAKVIYFKPNGNWAQANANFYAHVWGGSGATSPVKFTPVATDPTVYQAEIGTHNQVIFMRMDPSKTVTSSNMWNNPPLWNRMGNLSIPTDGKNCCTIKDNQWSQEKNTTNGAASFVTWSTYTPPVTHTFAKNSTLYIDFRAITDASKRGANYPKAGTASGLDYSANAGGTVIPVTFTADVTWTEGAEFMKTDQGGWASIPFKAPSSGENCAQVAADGKSYTWTTYSEPSVTLSLDKTEADAGTEVTVTLTATADNVSGDVTYAFQYSTDNSTWNNITSTNNTASQTFTAETRYYKVTMTNGGTTKVATAKFTAIKFHVIGSWDEWATHNEVVDGSKTITLEANKTYEYKITNGTWDLSWGNDGTMDRNNCTDWSFESNNNAKIKTDEAGDYVFNVSRNTEGKVVVSVTYPELSAPIPTFDYYIVGSFNGDDPKKAENGMTLDGTVYKATVTLAAGENTLKVTDGTWDNTWGYGQLGAAYEEVSDAGAYNNIKITLAAEKTITVIFDATGEGKITFEGLTPITYSDITIKAYTESAAPQIWWWNGGSKCPDADKTDNPSNPGNKYTWETAPTMTAVAGENNWYEYTFKNVNDQTGICFKFKNATTESGNFEGVKADACYDVRDIANAKTTECGVTPSDCLECSGIYLKGTFNSWGTDHEFMKTADANVVTTTVTITQEGNYNFKVHATDWLGNDGGTMKRGGTGVETGGWTMEKDKNEVTLAADMEGDYIFTYTISTKKLAITFPVVVPQSFPNQPTTLYFHPSSEWKKGNERYAAYIYNNGADNEWINLTDANSDGIYELANPQKYAKVIICRMDKTKAENNWENKWDQIESGINIPNTAGDLNTCLAFWKNCQGNVPTSECTWVAPTPLTDKNWSAFVAAYNGKTINAVVERSFKSSQYHTLCLPFDIPTDWLGEGTEAYQLTSIVANNTGDKLSLNATLWNTIVAGQPYIILPVKGSEYEHVIINGVTVKNVSAGTNVASGDGYKATLKAVTTTDGKTNGSTEYYVGANDGKLYHAEVDKLGLRAIIELTTTSGQPLPPKVRAYVAAGENEATGVEDIITTDAPQKVIENGQLIIIREGVKYNVQGQVIR